MLFKPTVKSFINNLIASNARGNLAVLVSSIPNNKPKEKSNEIKLINIVRGGYAFSKQALILRLKPIKHRALFDSCARCF